MSYRKEIFIVYYKNIICGRTLVKLMNFILDLKGNLYSLSLLLHLNAFIEFQQRMVSENIIFVFLKNTMR